ncbi:MerR family transcriptional regulator [Conexibacter sp. W3-3-2]|uniref:HTH merR-type domain-containing protein n=1 Tax=Paraconexibacter algicola TaxID=2133960 RepID=A0A2T4UGE6_9ACTN|nr:MULTISPECIES: MerR family transcriptional regulator [Solirubrobacterales]MTD44593.1 MerR family transcriptional regulator [Conexibacter sp. W3-3-2]PTL58334.1 hypothetical protein C7Y72_01055 [Paraconexibacter algicola]
MSEFTQSGELTIEQLAAEVGMSVRNIRAHQSRGLLDPPEVRGRTGYYGPQHVDRLRLIRDMQADGLNLAAISKLVGTGGEEFAGFRRALATPFETAGAQIMDGPEVRAALGGAVSEEVIDRAQKLGLFRPLGDDRFEVTSPRLLRAAEEITAIGLPHEVGLDVLEKLDRHAQSIAKIFVELFLEEIWKPFQKAGMPPEDWARVRDALERLRPLAGESLLGMFEPAMSEAVERAADRVADKLGRDARRS